MYLKVIPVHDPQQCLVPGCGAHSYHRRPPSAGNVFALLKPYCPPTLRFYLTSADVYYCFSIHHHYVSYLDKMSRQLILPVVAIICISSAEM